MLVEIPLINGVAYGWASIRFSILGAPAIGVTSIAYGDKEVKTNEYGAGRMPIARGYGNVEVNPVQIGMYKELLEALQKVAPGGRITDIPPFDVTVCYRNKANRFTKDVLPYFEFTENKVEANQGDTKLVTTIECICAPISWGVN